MGIEDQAFQSGTVAGFDGPSGLLQTLLAFILGTEVTGESLAGAGVSWAGTLANTPVGLGRVVIDYTIAGTPYQAVDNGAGDIVGEQITVGAIDYVTGIYSVTFASAPTGTPTIDYLYGQPGQDWRQLEYRDTEDNAGDPVVQFGPGECKECILQNTGISGLENVMIGMREWKYSPGNQHSWDLNGYINYTSGLKWNANNIQHGYTAYNTTLEAWTNHPQLPLQDDLMYYWFMSNRQRVIVIVKVQSNYESMYLGFGFRYGSPTEYPYPLSIKGSSSDGTNFSSTSATRRFIAGSYWNDNGYQNWIVDPQGAYRITDGGSGTYSTRGTYLSPTLSFGETGDFMGKTPIDKLAHLQNVYVIDSYNKNVLMQLDGVYHVASVNIQSEDVLHMGGVKHRIWQDIHRTSYWSFMAVEEQAGTTTTTSTTTTSTTVSTSSTTTTTSTTSTTTTVTSTTTTTTVP